MDLSTDPPPPELPRQSWLPLVIMVTLGTAVGCATAVGILNWWDHERWARLDAERRVTTPAAEQPLEAPKGKVEPTDGGDHLSRFNEQFRDIYRLVRADAVASVSPLVLVSGDDLVLFHKGMRTPVRCIPERYHELKAYAHVPLAAYLVTGIDATNSDIPSSRQRGELKKLLDRLPELREELKNRDYAPETMARQDKLIAETQSFLSECQQRADEKRPITEKERGDFAWKLREPIQANVREAAALQIEALSKQMETWRKQFSEAEWKQLKVVVVGSAMPRKNNLAVQYFAGLLGERGEDRRIIYAESLYEEPRALSLLGTHIVDEGIGRAFFHEPTRMKRDLLGDDAESILEEIQRRRKN